MFASSVLLLPVKKSYIPKFMSSDEEKDAIEESEVSDADDYSSAAEDRSETEEANPAEAEAKAEDDGKVVTWEDLVSTRYELRLG